MKTNKSYYSKGTNSVYLSVVIPAYNEEENFNNGALSKVAKFLETKRFFWEVILVDDGSKDKTYNLLQKFSKAHKMFRVIKIPHGGKVKAVTAGVFQARGEIVLFTDFDQSTPIESVDKFLVEFKKGADVVIADRYGKGAKRLNDSFDSLLRSKIFNWAVQFFIMKGISDTQCGFKAFKRDVAKKLFGSLQVYKATEEKDKAFMGAFDVELLFLARKYGFKIVSVPVMWRREVSKRLTVSEPIRMFFDVLKMRWRDLFGRYDKGVQQVSTHGLIDIILPIIAIILFTIPAVSDIVQKGYFPMDDDLQAMRQLQMDKCFQDGQIPCRWVPDMGYGYGYPLFNFYPPGPYYIGQIVHWLGFSFLDTVKVLFILAFVVSGITMYLLAKEFWGKLGGLVSSAFYIWAPYHSVDVYVRGAMNEMWAIAWFPGILWAIYNIIKNDVEAKRYKIIKDNKWKYVPILAFFIGMAALSHNPTLMVFAPGSMLWALFWLLRTKKFTVLPKLLVGGFWALGLAAFFTLPVLLEGKFVHLETLVGGYFNYLAHFISLNQLFISRRWGYGPSEFGPNDDASFQIGHLHWIASIVALVVAWRLRKTALAVSLTIIFFFLWSLVYTFLLHERSTPVWQIVKPLEFLQFPWRFLTLIILGVSFLTGSLVLLTRRAGKLLVTILLIVGVIILNRNYFHWEHYWPWVNDQHKFSGELWQLQITAGIFDYLPVWAPMPPKDPPKGDAEFTEGQGNYKTLKKISNFQEFSVSTAGSAVFQMNTFYFPGWRIFVDGKKTNIDPKQDPELGRMRVAVEPGEHKVIARFTNTPVRTVGNLTSLVSWLFLLLVVFRPKLLVLARQQI